MELNHYKEIIGEITSGAMQEVRIERLVQGIAEHWKDEPFETQPYEREGEVRGEILVTIESIVSDLEEQNMELQAAQTNRYVVPHIRLVQVCGARARVCGVAMPLW